jgi:hypothetical protein
MNSIFKHFSVAITLAVLAFTQAVWAQTPTGTFDLEAGEWVEGTGAATWNGTILTVNNGADIEITGTVTGGRRIEVASGATASITLDGVSITGLVDLQSPLLLNAGANVTITLMGNNTLYAGNQRAGIQAPAGTTLTITGKGSLHARGDGVEGGGAGIGGGDNEAGGNISILDGVVTATVDGGNGAGIGGGGGGNGGTIVISGGTVAATGGFSGAGIGGGFGSNGGTIVISGGTVTATGGSYGAGIGGGDCGNGGKVTISGGTVTANGNDGGAGIGGGEIGNGGEIIITGGSVKATRGNNHADDIGKGEWGSDPGTLTNDKNEQVWLNTLTTVPQQNNTIVENLSYGNGGTYGVDGMATDNAGILYLYLPHSNGAEEEMTALIGEITYTANYIRAGNHSNEAELIVLSLIVVSFNANGGEGTMSDEIVDDGNDYTIKENTFTRAAHELAKWNTQSNGLGTAYEPGATISNVTQNITLYAQWMQIEGTPDNPWKIGTAETPGAVTAVLIDGTLTISGNGKMKIFELTGAGRSPWRVAGLESDIHTLIIEDDVTHIGDYVFSGCTGLTSVTIPENVTFIGDGAFQDCTNLTTINYNATNVQGVSVIHNWMNNAGRSGPVTVNIGNNVIHIPNGFLDAGYAPNLTTLNLGTNVKTIGEFAFNRTALTSVIIPASVTTIGRGAFSSIPTLTRVDFLRPEPMTSIGSEVFSGTHASLKVYGFNENTSIRDYSDITFVPYVFELSLDPSEGHTFASATYGYNAQGAHEVSVTHENVCGEFPLSHIGVTLSLGGDIDAFVFNKTNGLDFTVSPALGLNAGTHEATVTVKGVDGSEVEFDVSFTVEKIDPQYALPDG